MSVVPASVAASPARANRALFVAGAGLQLRTRRTLALPIVKLTALASRRLLALVGAGLPSRRRLRLADAGGEVGLVRWTGAWPAPARANLYARAGRQAGRLGWRRRLRSAGAGREVGLVRRAGAGTCPTWPHLAIRASRQCRRLRPTATGREVRLIRRAGAGTRATRTNLNARTSVSYTHLTLPTILLV